MLFIPIPKKLILFIFILTKYKQINMPTFNIGDMVELFVNVAESSQGPGEWIKYSPMCIVKVEVFNGVYSYNVQATRSGNFPAHPSINLRASSGVQSNSRRTRLVKI